MVRIEFARRIAQQLNAMARNGGSLKSVAGAGCGGGLHRPLIRRRGRGCLTAAIQRAGRPFPGCAIFAPLTGAAALSRLRRLSTNSFASKSMPR
jgi:hypothetical protein